MNRLDAQVAAYRLRHYNDADLESKLTGFHNGYTAAVADLAAEQPATPTPSTEQIAAALDEYRSRLEEEDPAIQRLNKTDPYVVASIFNQGYQAALVSPVSEQPTTDAESERRRQMDRDYWAGKWCGECRYGVVEDPPCCTQPEQPTPLDPEPKRGEVMVEDGETFVFCPACNTWLSAEGYENEPLTLVDEHEAEIHDARYEQGGDR